MANHRRGAAVVRQRQSAEAILDLINALPRAEKNTLFESLAGLPENKPVSDLLLLLVEALGFFDKLWRSTEKLWGGSEAASAMRRQLDGEDAERLFKELRQRAERLQRKRGMTPANRETLEQYCRLVDKYGAKRGSKTRALEELVLLPTEQGKGYVIRYKETCRHRTDGKGDMEALRQHVKQLRARDRRRRL